MCWCWNFSIKTCSHPVFSLLCFKVWHRRAYWLQMSVFVWIAHRHCFSKCGQNVPDIADSHSSDHLRKKKHLDTGNILPHLAHRLQCDFSSCGSSKSSFLEFHIWWSLLSNHQATNISVMWPKGIRPVKLMNDPRFRCVMKCILDMIWTWSHVSLGCFPGCTLRKG